MSVCCFQGYQSEYLIAERVFHKVLPWVLYYFSIFITDLSLTCSKCSVNLYCDTTNFDTLQIQNDLHIHFKLVQNSFHTKSFCIVTYIFLICILPLMMAHFLIKLIHLNISDHGLTLNFPLSLILIILLKEHMDI